MNIRVSRRESLLILILGILLILLVGGRLLILPAYESWTTRSAQVAALQSARREQPGVTGQENSIDNEAAQAFTSFFLPKANPEDFHRYIRDYVNSSGLTLVSVSVSEMDSSLPQGFSLMGIRLSLTGTQAEAMRFLEEIERADKAIAVENMSLSPISGGRVSFDVGLKAYCVENGGELFLGDMPAPGDSADGFRFVARTDGASG